MTCIPVTKTQLHLRVFASLQCNAEESRTLSKISFANAVENLFPMILPSMILPPLRPSAFLRVSAFPPLFLPGCGSAAPCLCVEIWTHRPEFMQRSRESTRMRPRHVRVSTVQIRSAAKIFTDFVD